MARPAWVDIPDADVAVNAPLEAADVGQALRDNMESLRIMPISVYFAEASTTSVDPTFATIASVELHVPDFDDYTGIQRRVVGYFEVKIADAASTGTFRLREQSLPATSNQVTTTSTSYEYKAPGMDLPAAAQNTVISIKIQAHTSNGSHAAFARSLHSIGWYLEY